MFCLNRNESAELPPPLPPRRKMQSFNHVYTPINSQNEASAKTRKSSWNLKNVFGRTKDSSKNAKSIEVVKSQTTTPISQICADDCQSNLLASGKNSFSTPDLTNIIGSNKLATAPINCSAPTDETDLDVMDIERSNSLNCSASQFTCRPAPLNISDNILWSHNLSLTLSSTANSSAINLVGANVNGRDSYLGRDMSGYCKMAPILNKCDRLKLVRTSTMNFDDQLLKSTSGLDSSSIYCTMAPILPKTDLAIISKVNNESTISNITKNITFERTFDFDEDRPSLLDCSMKSIGNSNHASLSDITTSSGVSSYDGNMVTMNTRCITPDISTVDGHQENDDAISLTYTESPPQSAQTCQVNDNPFVYLSKFDEKTPSYFPNEKHSNVQEITKYTVNNKNNKQITKNSHQPSEPVTIPMAQDANNHLTQFKNAKKQTCKGVLHTPTSGKIQKFKRRNSIPENNGHFEYHPTAIAYKNENWYHDNSTYQTTRNYKYDTLPHSFDTKKVLSHIDPNIESNRHASFEKNSKVTRLKSSPRRIYNKCATLATRLKTPPSTPTEITPGNDLRLNSSIDTAMRTTKNFHIPNGADGSSNSILRSLTRFRKIDFSPLKKIIWQRPTPEF